MMIKDDQASDKSRELLSNMIKLSDDESCKLSPREKV